ncbi:FAD-dependent oxidoreductase [Lactiplantibacillus fabifermentans]|uniref:Nadh peroxidase npx n=1 Tax=Lactiplantibacillus fabifermentans DSM 21115 TaxID=1413187 RepID=A0A0R2NNP9_9LACO|nr:FAD-dependent oxidoreductase [Lactiplantibacillus fabifermentans]KRO25629.1 nadh peroxidase npx [Lactiplantibacillus fabifermentans DSM 21115]
MKLIVVGASHGGTEAVQTAIEQYPDSTIVWYEQANFRQMMGWSVEKLVAYRKKLTAQGVTLVDETRVVRLLAATHQLVIQAKEPATPQTVAYDKLILSPGSQARQLTVTGATLPGIVSLRGKGDLMWLREQARQNAQLQRIVVVGAGYIGLGAAEIFAQAHKTVTLIDVNEQPLHGYLDAEIAAPIAQTLRNHGIKLAMGQRVQRLLGEQHVTAVETDTATYAADLVVVAIGAVPQTQWLADTLALTSNGSVVTDAYQRTNLTDVLAIGDATQVNDGPTQQRITIALAGNARQQARNAVANLQLPTTPLAPTNGTSALPVFEYKLATTGLSEQRAHRLNRPIVAVTWTQPVTMNTDATVTTKLCYDPNTFEILGAQLVSTVDVTANINLVSVAIQAHFTIQQLATADFFFQPVFSTPTSFLKATAIAAVKQANQYRPA